MGENVSRRLREKTVERVLGMEMSFFDLEHADVSGDRCACLVLIKSR